MNSPFMGNRYLLLNVKLEVLKFAHIGELQLHLKDMWELSGMPSNEFCVHLGSDRLASLDGRGPVPNSRLAAAAPSTREETGAQQHVGAVDRRESGPLGQLPPLMNPERLQRLRRRQDASRPRQVGEQIVGGGGGGHHGIWSI